MIKVLLKITAGEKEDIEMHKLLLIAFVSFSFFILSGCASRGTIKSLDYEWGLENQSIQNTIGVRTYENISKDKAMNAMLVAFQRLDLIVENSDANTGFILATANAPKPLTHEEFERVIEIEDGRARSHVSRFVWNFRDFKSKFNTVFLETGEGVQISLRANLHFVGDRASFIPITEFPPEGVKISFPKIWNEFEKVAFIQEKTLKNN
jgi:hypothetical protein